MCKMEFHRVILPLKLLLYLATTTDAIFFGKEAKAPIPYIVLIKNDYSHQYTVCTGALVTYYWVLTHGPCLYSLRGTISIYINTVNVSNDAQIRKIKRTVIQEGYKDDLGTRGLALIELQTKAKLKPGESPISLTDRDIKDYISDGYKCSLKGYGYHYIATRASHYGNLHYQDVQSLTKGKEACGCISDELNIEQLGEVICTNSSRGRICLGDFGAPLVCYASKDYNDEKNPVLVGVANNFIPCSTYNETLNFRNGKTVPCHDNATTDIYTDVFIYKDWVISTIRQRRRSPYSGMKPVGGQNCPQPPIKLKILIAIIVLFSTSLFNELL